MITKNVTFASILVAMSFSLMLAAPTTSANTFSLLIPNADTQCPTYNVFKTGQQYVDSNNGVPQGAWSMLVRWQGNSIPGDTTWVNTPAYDQVQYTGLTVPAPYYLWQRGVAPQDAAAGTPAVQVHCFDAGMVVNSWYSPHQPVLGGGWNDMYGYAWSPGSRPKAFIWGNGVPAELVLQATVAIPSVAGYVSSDSGHTFTPMADVNDLYQGFRAVSIQYNLFAYIRDISHPGLHPVALLAGIYGNGPAFTDCFQNVAYDYAAGVWYAGTTILDPSNCSNDYSTVRYSQGYTTNVPFSTMTFYRVHFTRTNLVNIVAAINAYNCTRPCPSQGYSNNPDDYVIEYEGVILETSLCHPTVCNTGFADRQVGAGARVYGAAAYSYHP